MNYLKSTVAIAILVSSVSLNAQNIEATKFGKGVLNIKGKDNSWSMKFGARFQMLNTFYSTVNDGDLEAPATSFSIRRARLKFDGHAFSPKLQYKIELGLSNRDISLGSDEANFTSRAPRYIFDAIIKWNFFENFVLWMGQTKLPGNRERVISSGNMQMVDRSILNSRFNIDRDMGFQLRHHFNLSEKFIVREIFAVSQGEGRNVTVSNKGGLQYTGRIELLPLGKFEGKGDYSASDLEREKTPKLSLAATYDHNNDAVKTRSNMGSYMANNTGGFYSTNINTIFVDAMFKYQGFSLMGEYARRNAEDPIAKNEDGTATGDIVGVGNALNLQSGYLFKNNWEISGRYSSVHFDPVVNRPLWEEYTVGVSKFLSGHKLKVQTDFTYRTDDGENTGMGYRLQMDVHF